MYEEELYHWGFKRGEEKKNHKYFKRELVGTKNGKDIYRYFYDKVGKNVKAANKTKTPIPTNNNVNGVKDVKKKLKEIGDKLVKSIKNSKLVKLGKKNVHKQMTEEQRKNYATRAEVDMKEKEKKYKYIARIQTPDGKTRYFYNKNELEAYYKENGNDVDKTLLKRYGLKQEPDVSINDQHVINDKYDGGSAYYSNNCYSCAIAYDMRRRGFDVEAIPDADGLDVVSIVDCYKSGASLTRTNSQPLPTGYTKSAMYKDMKSMGDGAHGIFMVTWKQGGGHAMSWEVKNNKVIIRDCQTNRVYSEQFVNRILKYSRVDTSAGGVYWLRTDNLELDESVLKYVQKNT